MASDDISELVDEISAEGKREQSTIAFPYADLDTAVEVAHAVYNRSGLGACEIDELAAELKQTVSGAFRLKLGAARVFELIERESRGSNKLSDLGRLIIASETEKSARAEAFLRVPLYSAIYEKYKGQRLPPMKALEREMLGLGVSSKQTDKARQAFDRSARQAGFFDHGEDRLVRPKVNGISRDQESQSYSPNSQEQDKVGAVNKTAVDATPSYHPFIEGLLKTLPEPESVWSVEDRGKWLQTASSIFGLIYKGDGVVKISVEHISEK